MDFIFCAEPTVLKRKLGIPREFLLELHGWWHVLTAIGAHTFMYMIEVLTREEGKLSGADFNLFSAKTAKKEE
jgi:dihydroceramidase